MHNIAFLSINKKKLYYCYQKYNNNIVAISRIISNNRNQTCPILKRTITYSIIKNTNNNNKTTNKKQETTNNNHQHKHKNNKQKTNK